MNGAHAPPLPKTARASGRWCLPSRLSAPSQPASDPSSTWRAESAATTLVMNGLRTRIGPGLLALLRLLGGSRLHQSLAPLLVVPGRRCFVRHDSRVRPAGSSVSGSATSARSDRLWRSSCGRRWSLRKVVRSWSTLGWIDETPVQNTRQWSPSCLGAGHRAGAVH
jgi:hypothetical protein